MVVKYLLRKCPRLWLSEDNSGPDDSLTLVGGVMMITMRRIDDLIPLNIRRLRGRCHLHLSQIRHIGYLIVIFDIIYQSPMANLIALKVTRTHIVKARLAITAHQWL
jgi:hypothetical protein